MKQIIYTFLVLAFISCKTDKIAYVDSEKLMDEYQEKADIEERFKEKAASVNKKRDSLSQAFQLEYQSLQANSKDWPQKKMEEELNLFQQKTQFVSQQIQQEEQQLQAKGQAEMDSLVVKIRNEIKAYGKNNAYTYIFTGGDGGSVLYGSTDKDITDKIITILNDKYKK